MEEKRCRCDECYLLHLRCNVIPCDIWKVNNALTESIRQILLAVRLLGLLFRISSGGIDVCCGCYVLLPLRRADRLSREVVQSVSSCVMTCNINFLHVQWLGRKKDRKDEKIVYSTLRRTLSVAFLCMSTTCNSQACF
jgi:hypothetical protein